MVEAATLLKRTLTVAISASTRRNRQAVTDRPQHRIKHHDLLRQRRELRREPLPRAAVHLAGNLVEVVADPTERHDHGVGVAPTSGIGTTAPGYLFDVNTGSASFAQRVIGSGVDSSVIRFENTSASGGRTYHVGSTAAGSGAGNGFSIYDVTGSTSRLLINPNGNVGIGTTSPSYTLHVNGSVAGNGAYISTSDIRLKKDVQDLVGSLAKVLAIRGVSYKWIDEEKNGSGTQYGVIAQEIEKILPDVVVTGSDGITRVKYDDLIPVIIEALKTEKASKDAEVAQLKAESAQLKARADQADAASAQLKAESAQLKADSAQLKASLCGKFPDLPACSE